MGCCRSSLRPGPHAAEKPPRHRPPPPPPTNNGPSFSLNAHQAAPPAPAPARAAAGDVPVFAEFSLAELRAATAGFAPQNIVSESGEKAPNLVYRGQLKAPRGAPAPPRAIAVKKFAKLAWPDPKQFAVGKQAKVRLLSFGLVPAARNWWGAPSVCLAWVFHRY